MYNNNITSTGKSQYSRSGKRLVYGLDSDISESDLIRLTTQQRLRYIRDITREAVAEVQKSATVARAVENHAARTLGNEIATGPVYNEGQIAFQIADRDEYIAQVASQRAKFSNSNEWADYVRAWFPELDADAERERKVAENKTEKIQRCGHTIPCPMPDGSVGQITITCGMCDKCVRYDAGCLLRRLAEAEAAHGDLMVIECPDKTTRAKIHRALRYRGLPYRTFAPNSGGYEVVVPKADLSGVKCVQGLITRDAELTPSQTEAWTRTRPGEGQFGPLVENKKQLRQRYKTRGEYEVAEPFDENGQLRADVQEWALTAIDTTSEIKRPVHEAVVETAEQLQLALDDQADRVLNSGIVISGVYNIKYYTLKTTNDEIIAKFNRLNAYRDGGSPRVSEDELSKKLQNLTAAPPQPLNFAQKLAMSAEAS